MDKHKESNPRHIDLNLDDLDLVLDALKAHIADIDQNRTYTNEEKCYALLHAGHVLGTIGRLFRQASGEGYPAILRYQPIISGTTVPRFRRN